MKNLAGDKEADKVVEEELQAAGIPLRELSAKEYKHSEVPATVGGQLGTIKLKRAWCYWVANGPVPLEIALKLYADPEGKKSVRVAGHCGCPAPEAPWLKYYDKDNRNIQVDPEGKEEATCVSFKAKGYEGFQNWEQEYCFVRTPEERDVRVVKKVVEAYHIDSAEGLKLFADTLKAST